MHAQKLAVNNNQSWKRSLHILKEKQTVGSLFLYLLFSRIILGCPLLLPLYFVILRTPCHISPEYSWNSPNIFYNFTVLEFDFKFQQYGILRIQKRTIIQCIAIKLSLFYWTTYKSPHEIFILLSSVVSLIWRYNKRVEL